MRYGQVFNKRFCKSDLLINLFVLNAGARTEKGENISYPAPLKTSHHNKEKGNTLGE